MVEFGLRVVMFNVHEIRKEAKSNDVYNGKNKYQSRRNGPSFFVSEEEALFLRADDVMH